MAIEKSIDTNTILKEINKTIREIKTCILTSNLSVMDVKDIQKDLDKVKQKTLSLKGKFQ
ncbi:MAG: hypothetical protein AB8G86_27585 [Saprospiraceae bacterium]